MAIPLTGTGGLFTRLGRVGKLIDLACAQQAAMPAGLEGLFASLDGLTPPGMRDTYTTLLANRASVVASATQWGELYRQVAESVLLAMVRADVPARSTTVVDALTELIRQMGASSASVAQATVGVSVSGTGRVGDGVLLATPRRGDGRLNELLVAESASVQFDLGSALYQGQPESLSRWDFDWPAGSGSLAAVTLVTPTTNNLLTNGDFSAWTVNVPDGWLLEAGVGGTDVIQENSVVYGSTSSLRTPGGGTAIQLSQSLTGLQPLTSYGVALWVRVATVPAAGVLTVELVDGSGTVIQDQQASNNSGTISITGLTNNTWTPFTFAFRTPRGVPPEVRLRIRESTGISSGSTVYLGRAAFSPLVSPYPGGPGLAVFDGATAFATGDTWSVAVTNNRAGATNGATFQALFDRLFDLRSLGLQLPTAGSPTIADTLITS